MSTNDGKKCWILTHGTFDNVNIYDRLIVAKEGKRIVISGDSYIGHLVITQPCSVVIKGRAKLRSIEVLPQAKGTKLSILSGVSVDEVMVKAKVDLIVEGQVGALYEYDTEDIEEKIEALALEKEVIAQEEQVFVDVVEEMVEEDDSIIDPPVEEDSSVEEDLPVALEDVIAPEQHEEPEAPVLGEPKVEEVQEVVPITAIVEEPIKVKSVLDPQYSVGMERKVVRKEPLSWSEKLRLVLSGKLGELN